MKPATPRVAAALKSVPDLLKVLSQLTEDELVSALELESMTTRRRSIIKRLIGRAVSLRARVYREDLERKYHG